MSTHALLAPSAAKRWIACTPSARLEIAALGGSAAKSSSAADEGTLAHKLSEIKLNLKLGNTAKVVYKRELAELMKDPLWELYYQPEMETYTDEYVDYVLERYNEALAVDKDAMIFIEARLSMARWIPEGFGTMDVVIVCKYYIELCDLKYGKGVHVDAVENEQLKVYALGAYDAFEHLFDEPEYKIEVKCNIIQPRIENFSRWETNLGDVLYWANTVLVPAAVAAFDGRGTAVAGDHCKFCKAAQRCKANRDYMFEHVHEEFENLELLSDEELIAAQSRAKAAISWLNNLEKYMLRLAVEGKKWDGLKVVRGRSNRVIVDPAGVAAVLIEKGFDEEELYRPRELKTLTTLEALVKKADFAKFCAPFIRKPKGAPALVPLSDKRDEADLSETDGDPIEFKVIDEE